MSLFNGEFFEVTEAKYVTWGHRKFGLLKLRHGTKRGSSTRKQIVSHTGCVPGWTSVFFFFSFFCGHKIEENFIQIYSLPRFLGQQNEKKRMPSLKMVI